MMVRRRIARRIGSAKRRPYVLYLGIVWDGLLLIIIFLLLNHYIIAKAKLVFSCGFTKVSIYLPPAYPSININIHRNHNIYYNESYSVYSDQDFLYSICRKRLRFISFPIPIAFVSLNGLSSRINLSHQFEYFSIQKKWHFGFFQSVLFAFRLIKYFYLKTVRRILL